MKKMIVLALLSLAGCPSTVSPGRGTSPNGYGLGKVRCPDPSTDCTVSNGRSVTGVIASDAPAHVTSLKLRSGEVINVK